jgi:hypothetical protein
MVKLLFAFLLAVLIVGCSSPTPKPYVIPPMTPEQKAAQAAALAELLYKPPAHYSLIPPACLGCNLGELAAHNEKIKYQAEAAYRPEQLRSQGWTVVDCDVEPEVCRTAGHAPTKCDEFPRLCKREEGR